MPKCLVNIRGLFLFAQTHHKTSQKRDSHLVDSLILQQQSQGLLQHIVGQGCEEPEPQTTHFRSGNLVEHFLSCAVQRCSYPWPCPAWDRAGPWWAQTWTWCSSIGSITSSMCLASFKTLYTWNKQIFVLGNSTPAWQLFVCVVG